MIQIQPINYKIILFFLMHYPIAIITMDLSDCQRQEIALLHDIYAHNAPKDPLCFLLQSPTCQHNYDFYLQITRIIYKYHKKQKQTELDQALQIATQNNLIIPFIVLLSFQANPNQPISLNDHELTTKKTTSFKTLEEAIPHMSCDPKIQTLMLKALSESKSSIFQSLLTIKERSEFFDKKLPELTHHMPST